MAIPYFFFLNSSSTCRDVLFPRGPKLEHKLFHLVGIVLKSLNLKPRPNVRIKPTQHIVTLLGATCCVRYWPPCCDMLGVVGSSLTIFKLEPTTPTPNMSQHVSTRRPNVRNMLRPTVLRYVALTGCDRS